MYLYERTTRFYSFFNMEKVTIRTTSGINGKIIACPFCAEHHTFYHFSWASFPCNSCKKIIGKFSWNIVPKTA
jgi:hypothetical protein